MPASRVNQTVLKFECCTFKVYLYPILDVKYHFKVHVYCCRFYDFDIRTPDPDNGYLNVFWGFMSSHSRSYGLLAGCKVFVIFMSLEER